MKGGSCNGGANKPKMPSEETLLTYL